MTFVIIASFIHQIRPVVENLDDFYCVKKFGPKAFFYYNGNLPEDEVIPYVKAQIKAKLGSILVYEIYPLYKGIIDHTPYLPTEMKESKAYYQRKKDLSDAELEAYKQAHQLK